MKFETLKSRAAAIFVRMVDGEAAAPGRRPSPIGERGPQDLSFRALAADLGLTEALRTKTLAEVKAAGLSRIVRWDVREAGRLIDLFPGVAPSLVGKPLAAYMADNDSSDWMVELAKSPAHVDHNMEKAAAQVDAGALLRVEHFNVRIVRRGERYGREDCLVHDKDDPLVEFYDARQSTAKFGPRGQFVSRYFAATLMERHRPTDGLLLDAGAQDWVVSAEGMRAVMAHVKGVLGLGSAPREAAASTLERQALVRVDEAFDRLNALLDASGSLESEAIQHAAYSLRLQIAHGLQDQERIKAAEASLQELERGGSESPGVERARP